MVAIFPSSSTSRARSLEQEINELAIALHRKQQIKNIEARLNAIAYNLGKVESSPQQKRLREDLAALALAAGITLAVVTANSHINNSPYQPVPVPVIASTQASIGVRSESTTKASSEIRAEPARGTSAKSQSESKRKITAAMHAIIGQESNGKFHLVNPHSGALGYGQVMPENVKPWTIEALGYSLTSQEFLQSPSLQLKVIKHQLTKAYNSQSVAGRSEEEVIRRIAAIWYSGQSRLWNNTRPQYYNGYPYPSIAEYTASVYQRYQSEIKAAPSEVRSESTKELQSKTPSKARLENKSIKTFGNLLLNFFNAKQAKAATNKDAANKIVAQAFRWVGKDYKPGEFARCADFVRNVFRESGIDIGVSTKPVDADKEGDGRSPYLAQSFFGEDIGKLIWDKSQLKPGDLVAFKNSYDKYKEGTITHVGIYVGNGMMVDRGTNSKPIFHRPINTFKFLVGVRPHAYGN